MLAFRPYGKVWMAAYADPPRSARSSAVKRLGFASFCLLKAEVAVLGCCRTLQDSMMMTHQFRTMHDAILLPGWGSGSIAKHTKELDEIGTIFLERA